MLNMNIEGYLHIRVPTQIELNLTDSQIKQNSVEGTVKTISKPDQEAINREMSKVGLNINKMGNKDLDFGSIASRMVGGGVGQCFDHLNQTLPQIATELGLPVERATEVLTNRLYSPEINAQWQRSWENGITGVPTFVSHDLMVVGQQSSEVLARFVRHLQTLPIPS